MIMSRAHAERVQQKRFNSGKKGVAKAVRRFNKMISFTPGGWDVNLTYQSNFEGCRSYEETRKDNK